MENFIKELQEVELKTNLTASQILTIQQTQRNGLKAKSIKAFYTFFKENLSREMNVDLVSSGIILSVYNDSLGREICFEINPTIKSLDFDVEDEVEAYKVELKEKEAKNEEAIAKKNRKIENDKRIREETAKLRAKKEDK